MTVDYLATDAGHRLAYQQLGKGKGVVFLCGFRSDMQSTKASALAEWCAARSIPFTRFDYFGHGQSEGDFKEYTIGKGIADTLEVLDKLTVDDQVLVGSSMGGWIATCAALERKHRVRGLVTIAAAPDFTETLMFKKMTAEQRRDLEEKGEIWVHSSCFNNDYPITRNLIHNGRQHLLLDDTIPLELPVHMVHGQEDSDVPWEYSLELSKKIIGHDITLTLIKDGDHRLNRESDLRCFVGAVENIFSSI